MVWVCSLAKVYLLFVAWVGWHQDYYVNVLLMKQFWLSRHFASSMQLQVLSIDGRRFGSFAIVWINNCFHIWHVVIVYLYGISIKYFMEIVVTWETLSIKGKCFPTFLTTFTQYGRLNHIIFCFLFLVVVVFCLMFCCYCISYLHPAFVSATLHGLSFRIFIYLPITVIILILLILEAVWLWMGDDWILCWHKLFYCRILGKDGTLSFP